MKEKIIGILGGMGPESTAELLIQITRRTAPAVEQDHLRVLIDSNPKIPNRTDALLAGDLQPVIRALGESARLLEAAGAEVIGIPCNTAHAFLQDVRDCIDTPVVDMVEETSLQARNAFGDDAVVGLIATDGTIRTRLYHEALERNSLRGVGPANSGAQNAVMDAIETIKVHGVSDDTKAAIGLAIRDVGDQGATALIAGCTEISLIFRKFPPSLPWLDPLTVLADALIREAMVDGSGRQS